MGRESSLIRACQSARVSDSAAAPLRLLTGPDVRELLAAAVATAGGTLVTWGVTHVDHRPGRSTTVAYTARVRWADGEREEILGASAGLAVDGTRPGVLLLSDGSLDVAVWRFPLDPGLPALAEAADSRAVATSLLAQVGFATNGAAARLTVRAYRPRRRAVIEAVTPSGTVFLKVVRPERVATMRERYALLAGAGVPVPVPLGWREDGLLVLQALGGEALRDAVRAAGARAVDARNLVRLLDALPESLLDAEGRRSWSANAGHYAAVIGAVLPSERARAADLAAAVAEGLAGCAEPRVPVHGDYYDAQILVRGGVVTGLLDVDAAGPGTRADDLGCVLAHLEVLAEIFDGDAGRLREAVEAWLAVFDTDPRTTPEAIRLRTAGVLLSLATGPHRVQERGWVRATSRRLDLVEHWLDRARAG